MDVWGPARVHGQGYERYFLLVVDDYSRYTTVFPLRRKGEVTEVLIDWIRAARRQLGESFGSDLPVLRLHSDRGGEVSSDLLRAFCRAEGIRQTFTLLPSPQQNGIAERRIGMVMDIALRGASDQPPTPGLRAGDHTYSAVDGEGWQCVCVPCLGISSSRPQTSLPLPHCPPPPPPLFLAPGPPLVDPLPPQGPAPSGVSQVDAVEPVEVAVDSSAARGAEPAGARSGGAEPERAEPGGAEFGGPSGASSRWEPLSPQQLREWFARRWSRAAGAGGATGTGGPAAAGAAGGSGATGPGGARTGGTGAAGPGGAARAGAAGGAGDGGTTGPGATGGAGPGTAGASGASGGPAGAGAPGGAGAGGAAGAGAPGGAGVGATGAAGGAGGAGGATGVGADAGGAGAIPAGSGGAARPWPFFVPLLEQVLGLPPSTGPAPSLECPQSVQSESQLQPASPLPAPYTGPTGGLTERHGSTSFHCSAACPSAVSSSVLADPESNSLRAASPTFTRLLATVVTDPSFESTAASALVAELVDFAAHSRLDYAASLVAEFASVCPPSVGGECALSTDIFEDRQEEFQCFAAALPHLVSMLLALEGDPDAPDIPTPRSYAEAIKGPYSSQWQTAMDAEMASWKSTGTFVDEVPPPRANIVDDMWIFRVKRPPGSPPVFKARYVARGFSQRQGVDYFHTFSPTPKMTTLWVLLHVASQGDYELHSLDFSTAFLQGSLHEEIWLRRPPGFTGTFPPGTQCLRRPVYGLRQAPHEWHDTLRTTLVALGFAPSTADPSLLLLTDTTLPPLYILVYVDDLVFATADTAGLAHVNTSGMGLVLGGQARVVLTGHADASWVDDLATQQSSQGYTFSLGSGSVSWRSTRSSSVLSSRCEAEIYAVAMAAQELRWLTYLLTDLGEAPRSPPVLYVGNKAKLALCQEHRLEHRMKHIALRYFLA
ncbi:unnamed protein product [Closterium sp. NIES-53]